MAQLYDPQMANVDHFSQVVFNQESWWWKKTHGIRSNWCVIMRNLLIRRRAC